MSTRYDEKTNTIWIATDIDGDTLVPSEESQGWAKALREGKTADGRSLSAVNYVFSNEEAAEYNHHALAFSRIGTFTGGLDSPTPFGDAPDFEAKKDFGV